MVGYTIVVGVWQDHQASWPIELVGKSKEDFVSSPVLSLAYGNRKLLYPVANITLKTSNRRRSREQAILRESLKRDYISLPLLSLAYGNRKLLYPVAKKKPEDK